MGRLMGYMANRADRLRDALQQERAAIAVPSSGQPAGWGIGFYQGNEVLHKKRPLLDSKEVVWDQIAQDVRSDCVVIHLRHATVGDFRSENTHPFRMRSWLFAHSGTIDRFELIKPRLLDSIPDFIRRNLRGQTDSEHFFHALLTFLHDAGQLDRPDADVQAVMGALRSTVHLVERLSKEVGAAAPTLNFILTNGRQMFAMRRGLPLSYIVRDGIVDESAESDPRVDRTGPVRYVMVVSDGATQPPDYREVPDGAVAVISRDLEVTIESA